MTRPISQILLEDHNLSIRPSAKGDCPFCRHTTFSVKSDDTLGHCFHPACGRSLTPGHEHGQYRNGMSRVLEALYQDFHQELLRLQSGQDNAYTYLHDDRGIHPQVIAEAML